MSMFYCAYCDSLSDADDGCEEVPGPGFGLICAECAEEAEAEAEEAAEALGASTSSPESVSTSAPDDQPKASGA